MPTELSVETRGLTARRARFVEEYLVDLNATQAAIRAGYAPASAHVLGSRMLANDKVQAAIAKAKARRAERWGVTQDFVIEKLMIEATREGEGSSHSARVSALEKLGRHLGMFREKHEHEAGDLMSSLLRPIASMPGSHTLLGTGEEWCKVDGSGPIQAGQARLNGAARLLETL